MKKKLLIGADPFPPYQYYDEAGVLQGSDYETVKAAGEKAGFEMEFLVDDWPLVEAKLMAGELDACFQVQKTPEREAKLCYSKLLRHATTEVITGDPQLTLAGYDDIVAKNLTLGVLANYAYGDEVDALPDSCKKVYGTQEDLLRAVANGDVSAGIFDAGVRGYLMETLGLSGIYAIENLTFERPLYVVFPDSEICEAFNQTL